MVNSKLYSSFVKIFWSLFLIPIIFLVVLFWRIAAGNMGFMPDFKELEDPKSNLASEIFSSEKELLGKYYLENRTPINFNEISPKLVNALIATEDARFHSHSGIDLIALGRVVKGLATGKKAGGGSTISQQLAKNLFKRDTTKFSTLSGKVLIKLKEWVVAVKLEKRYTKDEIIAMYFNTVDFGSQSFGIKAAARTFFNKSPDSLKQEEAAVLVGLLKAPSQYNPKRNPNNSTARRNIVLGQMYKYDYLTEAERDSLQAIPLKLNYSVENHNKGLSPYFRVFLSKIMNAKKPKKKNYAEYRMKQYKEDLWHWNNDPLYGWCAKNQKPNGQNYNIYSDGLKIHTTINADMQRYAEKSVKEHLAGYLQPLFSKEKKGRRKGPFTWRLSQKQIDKILYASMRQSERYRVLRLRKNPKMDSAAIDKNFSTPTKMRIFSWEGDIDTIMTPKDSILYYKYYLNAGFMSVEPQSGFVRAYVGGINHHYFKYDHVTQAKRQVGSTFKPFVYSVGIMNGVQPCQLVPNIPHTIQMPEGQPPYTPKMSVNKRGPYVTVKRGLASSYNHISAWIMKQIDPVTVIQLAKQMGVLSYIEPVPSICVGAAEVTLSEMVGAYTTFVNRGIYTEPIFVTRIEDKNGNIIASFKARKEQAMNEETAWVMLQMLRGVVKTGTSTRMWTKYKLKNEIAGKTGTTNENSDGWFIGMTPNLVSGAWVGGDVRSIHFDQTLYGQGANMALPIWALYMQKVYSNSGLAYSTDDRFFNPEHEIDATFNCDDYKENNPLDESLEFEESDEFFQ